MVSSPIMSLPEDRRRGDSYEKTDEADRDCRNRRDDRLAYLLLASRRTQCDTIFEQTATRVGGNLDIIKNKGELFVGREQVQALTEGAQKVGLHLKSCCLSQQTGNMNHDEFQDCVNGAKDYESKVLLGLSALSALSEQPR